MPLSRVVPNLVAGAACILLGYWLREFTAESHTGARILQSPQRLPDDSDHGLSQPYPPHLFPGARTVSTPYGDIHVFEWGPEHGEKVLLIPGISTPVLSLGNVADGLVAQGFHVMMFDHFGRGWSQGPADLPYDSRLYVSQILLVLASSPLSWTGTSDNGGGFHLLGYSLGGGLAVTFARFLPHLVRSLTLVAPGGLLRYATHVGWQARLLYGRNGILHLPAWLRTALVRRRLRPESSSRSSSTTTTTATTTDTKIETIERDASGGAAFDYAEIVSKRRPGVTVTDVVSWQLDQHPGFVAAFMASLRDAPIFDEDENWAVLGQHLAARRADGSERPAFKRALLVLGSGDTVVPMDTVLPDARSLLGDQGLDVAVLDGGHEIVMTRGAEIVEAMMKYVARLSL